MADFTVNGKQYKSRKMDLLRVQMNVLRRIGPLVPAMMVLHKAQQDGIPVQTALVMVGDQMIAAFGSMSDADVDYVRNACLDLVEANINGAWVPLRADGMLMDGTLGLLDICQIMIYVLKDTFLPFFSGVSRLTSVGEAPKEAPQA